MDNKEKFDNDLNRIDSGRFNKDLNALINESEEMRLKRMKQYRARSLVAINFNILFLLAGVVGFGWFFLVNAQLIPAVLSIFAPLLPVILLNIWAKAPIKTYKKEHKTVFMPKLAKTLNGLGFYPKRGVSAKIIEKLAVIPAYDEYKAEDCFMGKYKGVKVIFSEARLYTKNNKNDAIFDGIFVLLETPEAVIDGHTIITMDDKMVSDYSHTRWKTMKKVYISTSDPAWEKFHIYSTKPDSAELMIGDRLLKELYEASEVFNSAPLTAVLFAKKYVFMMIPYSNDMFEHSNLFVPIKTQARARQCKEEIGQLLEIIDVFDLYKPIKST